MFYNKFSEGGKMQVGINTYKKGQEIKLSKRVLKDYSDTLREEAE